MHKALNSIKSSLRDLSYTLKSSGKKHLVSTINELEDLTVDQINNLDTSEVSDTLKSKIKKTKHQKSLGQAKIKALELLFIDKKLMPKISENSSARSGMADIRRTRNKKNKSIAIKADGLVNLVKVNWLLENLPEVPTDKITLSSSRRRGGRRKKTTRKKKKTLSAHKRK